MIKTHQDTRSRKLKEEVRDLRAAANAAAVSKTSARQFLISTGIYTPAGQLKLAFR